MVKPLSVSMLILHAVCAAAGTIDDPTRPSYLVGPEAVNEPSGWTLKSVILAPNYSLALINGKTVRIGERIDRAKVLRIEEDRVVLWAAGRREILRMFPSIEIKTKEGAKE